MLGISRALKHLRSTAMRGAIRRNGSHSESVRGQAYVAEVLAPQRDRSRHMQVPPGRTAKHEMDVRIKG